jgi:hypothetical protein
VNSDPPGTSTSNARLLSFVVSQSMGDLDYIAIIFFDFVVTVATRITRNTFMVMNLNFSTSKVLSDPFSVDGRWLSEFTEEVQKRAVIEVRVSVQQYSAIFFVQQSTRLQTQRNTIPNRS